MIKRTLFSRLSFIILSFVFLLSSFSFPIFPLLASSSNRGTSSANFLKLGLGARPAGMGEAFVAVDNDINALYWNPAGLYSIDRLNLSFMYLDWFEGINYGALAFAMPIKDKMSFGVTLGMLDYGNTIKTLEAPGGGFGGTAGTYSAADRELKFSVAYLFDFGTWVMPVGVNAKYIYQKIDQASASGGAIDLGLQFKLKRWRNFSAGFMLQHIGTMSSFDQEKDPLPFTVKAGVAYAAFRDRLNLVADLNFPRDNSTHINLGAEFFFMERKNDFNFALRTGFSSLASLSDREGFSLGAGFSYRTLEIDYAYLPFEILGNTHRVSLSYKFGPSRGAKMDKFKAQIALKDAETVKNNVVRSEDKKKRLRKKNIYDSMEINETLGEDGALFVCADRGFKTVGIAGDFNNWDYTQTPMKLFDDYKWRLRVPLTEGKRYTYKFVVNDLNWMADPDNPVTEPDGIGGFHSVKVYEKAKEPVIASAPAAAADLPIEPEPDVTFKPKLSKQDYVDSAKGNIAGSRYDAALRDVIEVMKMDPMDENALSLSIRLRKVIRIMQK